MTLKPLLRSVGERLAPELTARVRRQRHLRFHANRLRSELGATDSLRQRAQIAGECRPFRSNQKGPEIVRLLEEVAKLRPNVLCEIGTDKGGTLALFASVAAPRADVLSLDLDYPDSHARVYRRLLQRGQRLTCLQADSHNLHTLERVKKWLRGRQFDFLFIDGDHSYDGVKQDYEMYAPLVHAGGLVAFHDVVPDFRTRYGINTGSDVGEVPRFWQELKVHLNGRTVELIEDPEQDGYGIGVVRVNGEQP